MSPAPARASAAISCHQAWTPSAIAACPPVSGRARGGGRGAVTGVLSDFELTVVHLEFRSSNDAFRSHNLALQCSILTAPAPSTIIAARLHAVPAMGEHLNSIAEGATGRVQAAMACLRSRHEQDFLSKQLPLSSQPPSDQHGDGGTTAVTVCVLYPPVASTPPHRPPSAHV